MLRRLKSIPRRLATLVGTIVPSTAESRFADVNSRFWSKYRHTTPDAGFVLIEQQANPIVNHCNASFAAIVCHARQLRPVYMLGFWQSVVAPRVLATYGGAPVFWNTSGWRYLWPRIMAAAKAWTIFRRLNKPADILELKVDGIRFGDVIYDNVLLLGYATIKQIDLKVFAVLYAFFVHRHIIQDIANRFKPVTTVLSHTIGLAGATRTRYLLRAGCEVICRVGSHQIVLKKYSRMSEAWFYPLKPESNHFLMMMEDASRLAQGLATAYLEDRHNQGVNQVAVELAFDRDKQLFHERSSFATHFGLTEKNRNVFVMLHAFDDHPHSHFERRMLYQDYFDWFIKTLELAKQIPDVNWIFKEHPASQFHSANDVDLDAIFSKVNQANIRFLNSRADFNARSIRYVGDAIVTCLGTAGMEYACLGIPCVLAGESPYSGFGFTQEPADIASYEQCLRALSSVTRLTQPQIDRAKVVMFFELKMAQDTDYRFCTKYDYQTIMALGQQRLWHDLAELMENPEQHGLDAQVQTLSEFVRNPSRTQYLDLDKYPFMRSGK